MLLLKISWVFTLSNKEKRCHKLAVSEDNCILKWMLSIAFPLFTWPLKNVNKTSLVKKLIVEVESMQLLKFYFILLYSYGLLCGDTRRGLSKCTLIVEKNKPISV